MGITFLPAPSSTFYELSSSLAQDFNYILPFSLSPFQAINSLGHGLCSIHLVTRACQILAGGRR